MLVLPFRILQDTAAGGRRHGFQAFSRVLVSFLKSNVTFAYSFFDNTPLLSSVYLPSAAVSCPLSGGLLSNWLSYTSLL